MLDRQKAYLLTREQMRLEKIVEARTAELDAAVFTEDSQRISQAQEQAVEAFRCMLDARVGSLQYVVAVAKPRF